MDRERPESKSRAGCFTGICATLHKWHESLPKVSLKDVHWHRFCFTQEVTGNEGPGWLKRFADWIKDGSRHPLLIFRRPQEDRDGEPQDALKTDPRVNEFGPILVDEYATLRNDYEAPKHPIVLCHGLLGFDHLRPVPVLPLSIAYWRGVAEALTANGAEVFTTSVPSTGSIAERAEALMKDIESKAAGKTVNLIGGKQRHLQIVSIVIDDNSGLDARYMISTLKPTAFKVASLTTIATPHRGSYFADYIFNSVGDDRMLQIYELLKRFGLKSGAFAQLTTTYMQETFNPANPDDPDVRYYSYGASATPNPWQIWYFPYRLITEKEGENDGMVSVSSARWGDYKGTLVGPTHLDIINWTNRLQWVFKKRTFNAIAFYSDIGDMLAKEGL